MLVRQEQCTDVYDGTVSESYCIGYNPQLDGQLPGSRLSFRHPSCENIPSASVDVYEHQFNASIPHSILASRSGPVRCIGHGSSVQPPTPGGHGITESNADALWPSLDNSIQSK